MTAKREIFKNNSSTTLNGSINNSVTSITVTDGSVFPATGNFHLLIDSEIVLCTDRATHVLTVVRAQEGTTGASHADLATITLILTEESLKLYLRDNDPYHGSNRPAFRLQDASGNLLTSADFSLVNTDGETVSDQNGTIWFSKPTHSATDSITLLARSQPSTPYSIVAGFRVDVTGSGFNHYPAGQFGFRESSSGKFKVLQFSSDNGGAQGWYFAVFAYTDPNTFNATGVSRTPWGIVGDTWWLKISHDGTDLFFYISMDGFNWRLVHQVAKTTHFTSAPDQICWGFQNFGDSFYANSVTLVSWNEG